MAPRQAGAPNSPHHLCRHAASASVGGHCFSRSSSWPATHSRQDSVQEVKHARLGRVATNRDMCAFQDLRRANRDLAARSGASRSLEIRPRVRAPCHPALPIGSSKIGELDSGGWSDRLFRACQRAIECFRTGANPVLQALPSPSGPREMISGTAPCSWTETQQCPARRDSDPGRLSNLLQHREISTFPWHERGPYGLSAGEVRNPSTVHWQPLVPRRVCCLLTMA